MTLMLQQAVYLPIGYSNIKMTLMLQQLIFTIPDSATISAKYSISINSFGNTHTRGDGNIKCDTDDYLHLILYICC